MKPVSPVLVDIMKAEIYMERGIVPAHQTHIDVNRALADLPPEEARRAKRKFRKQWRAAQRRTEETLGYNIRKKLGVGGRPSKAAGRQRKILVAVEVAMEAERRARQVVEKSDE